MFYITTPIYYVNDVPHLGHAYTTILADVLARYHRLQDEEVFFLTGVDEHGQKVQNALKRSGVAAPTNEQAQAYVDEMARRFKDAWRGLNVDYDRFIRTTEPQHVRVVERALAALWDDGQIYRGEYEGWYCVPDERFWTEKDLRETAAGEPACPDCGRPVEQIVESNYFFRMSAYQDWLIEYIHANPEFILPARRRNEVLGFLRRPLGDLCISRPRSRLSWGIPLPFDADYVTYVWFDALLNYVTAAGYLEDNETFACRWPNALHLIGKDILTTHAVYWPTMLKVMGLPLPKTIFAHGWWITGGIKMSKSLGNAVRPLDLAQVYGVDAFRYFLLRDMVLGQDADFDAERVAGRYTVDLANNLGNLLQRVVVMIERYFGGHIPEPGAVTAEENALKTRIEALPGGVFDQVNHYGVNDALALCMDALTAVNAYLERTAPWSEAKHGRLERAGAILYTSAEALRVVSLLLSPVLPEKTADLWRRLGWNPPQPRSAGLAWGGLLPGARVEVGAPLFPQMEMG